MRCWLSATCCAVRCGVVSTSTSSRLSTSHLHMLWDVVWKGRVWGANAFGASGHRCVVWCHASACVMKMINGWEEQGAMLVQHRIQPQPSPEACHHPPTFYHQHDQRHHQVTSTTANTSITVTKTISFSRHHHATSTDTFTTTHTRTTSRTHQCPHLPSTKYIPRSLFQASCGGSRPRAA